MNLEKTLLKQKKKSISLEQIKSIVGENDEAVFREVKVCEDAGLLSPIISSKTNGNRLFPVYLKYRVCLPTEDLSVENEEILLLHPVLLENGILQKKPEEYKKYRKQFRKLNEWLFSHPLEPIAVSRKERSFEIFGEEKQLEESSFKSLLQRMGVTADSLYYYDTPEYCFNDYIPEMKNSLTLLICENKDIWFNIRRMMFEKGCFSLLGQRFDGVVYGCGNKVTEHNALTSYTAFMGIRNVHYFYWGDIDREGLNIYIKLKRYNPEIDIQLFTPAYKEMLDRSAQFVIPDSQDNREQMEDYADLLSEFDNESVAKLKQNIDINKRIPQEIINFATLEEIMR